MDELKMPVKIFRGDYEIGMGEFLPNGGGGLALYPYSDRFQLLPFAIDTELVEEKIPLAIYCGSEEVIDGELFQSGSNICVFTAEHGVELMHPQSFAELKVEPNGLNARLDIYSDGSKAVI
jgi:hypothetical protein